MANREIRFRVWTGHLKNTLSEAEMLYWWPIPIHEQRYNDPNQRRFSLDNWALGSGVMQYTGLKDRKGKEIYEGDIVQTYAMHEEKEVPLGKVVDGKHIPVPRVVEWREQDCGFNISRDRWNGYEVVGNIYENPELVEK